MVCSTPAAERVRALAGSGTQVIIDDRALDKRGVEMLAAVLVGQDAVGQLHVDDRRPVSPARMQ
jgi:hypothetical protein